MNLEEMSFEEFLGSDYCKEGVDVPPQLDRAVLQRFVSYDSTYLDSYRVMVVDGVPIFGRHTNEEKDDKLWRFYMEDMLLVPSFEMSPQYMADIVKLVSEETRIPVMTLPAYFGTAIPSDCQNGFWVDEHAVCLVDYKGGRTSKQRNEIRKSIEQFSYIWSRELSRESTQDVELVTNIVRDQAIYWRSRRGVTSNELDYAIRLWLWTKAAWLESKAKIVVTQEIYSGNQYPYISAVGLTDTNDRPGWFSSPSTRYLYTAFAQNPAFRKLDRIGVATLHHTFDKLKGSVGRVLLGVSSDAFTDFTYMNYKKHVSTGYVNTCAFAALTEPTPQTKPPYYNINSHTWVNG